MSLISIIILTIVGAIIIPFYTVLLSVCYQLGKYVSIRILFISDKKKKKSRDEGAY